MVATRSSTLQPKCRGRRSSRGMRLFMGGLPSVTPSNGAHPQKLRLPLPGEVPFELLLAREVLHRPGLRGVAELGGGAKGPVRVGEMGPGQGAEVGPAGGDDRVDLIGLGDVAD